MKTDAAGLTRFLLDVVEARVRAGESRDQWLKDVRKIAARSWDLAESAREFYAVRDGGDHGAD